MNTPAVTHNLKTDRDVFQLSWDGKKPFEIRYDDRCFQIGDEIVLFETEHTGDEMKNGSPLLFTGRRIRQKIISKVYNYGLFSGFCALGVEILHQTESPVTWQVDKSS